LKTNDIRGETMTEKAILPAATAILCLMPFFTACRPSCPETLDTYSGLELHNSDIMRVNRLVLLRKAAMEEIESTQNDPFRVRRLKFSVTAFEIAIETQVCIIILTTEYSDRDEVVNNSSRLSEVRCIIEEIASKEDCEVKDSEGLELQKTKKEMQKTYGRMARPRKRTLKKVFAKGLEPVEIKEEVDENSVEEEEDEFVPPERDEEKEKKPEDEYEEKDSKEYDVDDDFEKDDYEYEESDIDSILNFKE